LTLTDDPKTPHSQKKMEGETSEEGLAKGPRGRRGSEHAYGFGKEQKRDIRRN